MIPTSIDGTDITGATIDGTDVTEITVDGDTVFTAGPDIPDPGDLYARYDFSQETGTTPVSDLSGNNRPLNNGGFSGVGVTINGTQAGLFDGVDDFVNGQFANESQPNHIFFIFELVSFQSPGNNPTIFDADSSFHQTLFIDNDGANGDYQLVAGSRLGGSIQADIGDIVLASALFNGSSSELRINGTSFTGDAGTRVLDGITIGDIGGGGGSFVNIKAGEMLIYETDKSPIVSDIESFLIDKWGPLGLA